MKKKIITAIAAIMLMTGFAATASAHWADDYMNFGHEQGWLSAELSDPDSVPTYEQLILTIMRGLGWDKSYTGSEGAYVYYPEKQYSEYFDKDRYHELNTDNVDETISKNTQTELSYIYVNDTITDIDNTELKNSGLYEKALSIGILVTSDYSDNQLMPNRSSMRRDAIIILSRAMGLGSVVNNWKNDTAAIPQNYTDWNTTEDWIKPFIKAMQDCNVIHGDEYGNMNVNSTITVGELAALVCKTLDYETEGVDYEIKVQYSDGTDYGYDYTYHTNTIIPIQVPIQIINNVVYFPLDRDIFGYSFYYNGNLCISTGALDELDLTTSTYYDFFYKIGINEFKRVIYPSSDNSVESATYTQPGAPRILYGEFMLPVYDLNSNTPIDGRLLNVDYDSENKVLTYNHANLKYITVY